jgi:hypothetical protein
MSWFTDLYSAPYNAITGQLTQAQKDALTQDEVDQIHTVSDNAATYYGADSSTAAIAQQAADEQAAQAPTDTSTLAKLQATDKGACPNGGLNLNGVGLGCVSSFNDLLSQLNTLTHIGLALVGVLIVGWLVITFGPTVASFARRSS